jgi:hypothetical protein
MSSSKVFNAEGGLTIGQTNADSDMDSGNHSPLARATFARIIKGSFGVDASSSTIEPGAERTYTQSISTVAVGNLVQFYPSSSTVAGTSVFWSGYCTSGTLTLVITNQHASTTYNGNGDWYFVIYQFA